MTFKEFLPTRPTPASRPRVSRYGTYHLKGYSDFKNELVRFLRKFKKTHPPKPDVSYSVTIEIICRKPKKPSNDYPRGDLDNYLKGYMDAISQAGIIWVDDIQVTHLIGTKRYQDAEEEYGANVLIREV